MAELGLGFTLVGVGCQFCWEGARMCWAVLGWGGVRLVVLSCVCLGLVELGVGSTLLGMGWHACMGNIKYYL